MDLINVGLISEYMSKNNLTKKEFCKKCGISLYLLNKIFNQQENANIVALFKIARIMNLPICEFFRK